MMHTKFLVTAALVGGLIIFVWGGVVNMGLSGAVGHIKPFTDDQAVLDAVQAATDGNGVYMAEQGVLAAVSFRPDMADKTQNITGNLIIEFVTDCLVALLLGVLLLKARPKSVMAGAGLLALAGLAAAGAKDISDWNWYGFSAPFTGLEFAEIVIGWFVVGLVLTALMQKQAPAMPA